MLHVHLIMFLLLSVLSPTCFYKAAFYGHHKTNVWWNGDIFLLCCELFFFLFNYVFLFCFTWWYTIWCLVVKNNASQSSISRLRTMIMTVLAVCYTVRMVYSECRSLNEYLGGRNCERMKWVLSFFCLLICWFIYLCCRFGRS